MRRTRSPRCIPTAGACALLLLASSARPLAAQDDGPRLGVGLRIGVGGGGEMCRAALVPGAEVRTGGALYGVAVLDTYLFRVRDHDPCPTRRTAEGREEVTRVPVTAPRLRAGVGWAGALGETRTDARLYVGQQGVLEGFQPLAGVGVGIGRGAWGVEAGGTLHRADVNEVVPVPGTSIPSGERLLRREWVPSFEAAGRFDAGALTGRGSPGYAGGLGRPVLGGIAGGALGAGVGFLGGLTAARTCEGDEICLLPAMAGAVVGETLGVPLGVHLAEGRRGSYPLAALASVGVTAVGLGAMAAVDNTGASAQGIAILVPVAQLWASIAVERRTAR
ncbi:MAG TPA: hypothetical protein VFQ76_02165 [Longimicrobiaceae bacterium]|nr:hypothetical protein [Longimicrobiaceae bacterium]